MLVVWTKPRRKAENIFFLRVSLAGAKSPYPVLSTHRNHSHLISNVLHIYGVLWLGVGGGDDFCMSLKQDSLLIISVGPTPSFIVVCPAATRQEEVGVF